LNPRRISVDKARKKLPVYFLIFYGETGWSVWKVRDTIKLSDKRTYLTESSQIHRKSLSRFVERIKAGQRLFIQVIGWA